MAVFVFLTSRFVPAGDANGICVYNVAKELIKKGHEIYCICEGFTDECSEYEGIKIYKVKTTILNKFLQKAGKTKNKFDLWVALLTRGIRMLLKAPLVICFPNVAPFRALKEYKVLKTIQLTKKIDCVIGCFRPFEGIWATTKFKKNNPDIKTAAWFLDILKSQNPFGKFLFPLFNRLCEKSEARIIKVNDRIFYPYSAKKGHLSREDEQNSKIRFFDFPVFTNDIMSLAQTENKHSSPKRLCCIGSIDGKNRSAAYFLKIVDCLIERYGVNVEIQFVGNFTELDIFNKYNGVPYVEFCGQVSYDTMPEYIREADILINFGNKITYDMIPSKIFQYFASCKPIINIVSHKEDAALSYFEKYSLVCNIFEFENMFEKDAEELKSFILSEKENLLRPEDVSDLYHESKPAFLAKQFEDILQ